MLELKAPAPFADAPRPWVFLAGSIEQGRADRWQSRVAVALEPREEAGRARRSP